MARSLFSRLLKQQSTDKRSNLENYLTEALCEVLNRLSGEQQRSVLTALLGSNALPPHGRDKAIRWETQQTVATRHGFKRPDLMGYQDKKPVFLVEVKVDAAFTSGRESGEDQISGEDVHQLVMYGQWLQEANPDAQLVLLTWKSAPPADYLQEGVFGYGTRHRHRIYWQNVYDALAKVHTVPFVADFRSFLEEEFLAMDTPNRQDFALLELFLDGPYARVKKLMSTTRERLSTEFSSGLNWKREASYMPDGYQALPENQLIWAWGVLDRPTYDYIYWGIHFPSDKDTAWGWKATFPNMPRRPVIFVSMALELPTDGNDLLHHIPTGATWMRTAEGEVSEVDDSPVIAFAALEEFLAKEDPAEEMYAWVKGRFDELMQAVGKLSK